MRIALYARVSKDDASQDPANQLVPLRNYAQALGGTLVAEYVDEASGGTGQRVQFQAMLTAAEARAFDLLLIWALDRFSREGISTTTGYMARLKRAGVGVKSLKESWLDTQETGTGELTLAIFAWMAQQERLRGSERTKAALAGWELDGKAVEPGTPGAYRVSTKDRKPLGRPFGAKDKGRRKRSGYWLRHAATSPARPSGVVPFPAAPSGDVGPPVPAPISASAALNI